VKLIKIILINLVIFAVLLALINLGSGWYLKKITKKVDRDALPNYQDNREYARLVFKEYFSVQHQYEPFVGWKAKAFAGETTTISDEGNRVHKAPASNITDKKVVRFFGGSTMWGEGSDDDHTIPALFNALAADYQVYNHGQLAYNTRQELDALISSYSKGERADIVIFYDGVNEAAFLCPKEIQQLPAHRLVPMYREKLLAGKSAAVKEVLAKVFYANIAALIHEKTYKPTPENSPYDCVSNPAKAEKIADIMMRNWEFANEIVTNRGGKFIAVLQPAAFIGKPRTDYLELDEDLGKNFQVVYEQIRKKIAEKKYPWIYDLSDRFDGNDYIYIDFCHVSPNGNEIIAKEIARIVNMNTLEMQDGQISFLHP
jgi:hypothetical protein